MILAQAIAKPAPDGGLLATAHAGIVADLFAGGFGEGGLGEVGIVPVEAAVTDQATGNVLQVGLRVRVGSGGGQRVDDYLLEGGWSVDRSVATAEASASIPAILPGVLKDPLSHRSSPGGMDFWYLHLAIRGGDGELREYPLLSAGVAVDGQRTYEGAAAVESLTVADRLTRFRGVPVTRHFRAGHNLPTWRVVEMLAAAAGWTGVNIPRVGANHRRPLQVINGDWFGPAQAIAEAQGVHLSVDERGFLVGVVDRPELGSPAARWDFGPDEVVESVDGSPTPVVVSAPSGVLFKICATATEQISRPRCQAESVELPTEAKGNFAPKAAPWLQSSGGSRSFVTGAEVPAAERLRRFSLTKVTRECDAVLAIEERRRGYLNPVAAATTRNADGTVATYLTVYQEEDAETSTAHRWPVEHLVDPAAESSTSRTYDSAGYLSQTVEESRGYRNIERAVRSRATRNTAWDVATGPAGLLSLADGTGVVQAVETYQLMQRIETEFAQENGYQVSIRATTHGYRKRAGWQYLYADGSESSDERETWGVVRVVEESWTRLAEEGLHMYRREERGPDGRLARDVEEGDVVEIREGEPPAAEKIEDVNPQQADYDTLDEWREALAASMWETRELLVRRVRSGLPHPYREAEISFDYVETQAGLEARVDRALIKSAAMPVTWTVLPTPGIKRGDVAHLRVRAQLTLPGESSPRDVSLDHDVFIESMRWVGSANGASVLLELGGSIR